MKHYVIIGNGVAAAGCIEGIRSVDQTGEITAISQETHPVYCRPLISYYLEGRTDLFRMAYRDEDFYEAMGCRVLYGTDHGLGDRADGADYFADLCYQGSQTEIRLFGGVNKEVDIAAAAERASGTTQDNDLDFRVRRSHVQRCEHIIHGSVVHGVECLRLIHDDGGDFVLNGIEYGCQFHFHSPFLI